MHSLYKLLNNLVLKGVICDYDVYQDNFYSCDVKITFFINNTKLYIKFTNIDLSKINEYIFNKIVIAEMSKVYKEHLQSKL